MKIKDIRQFRTFFKKNVRETEDTNRDEHFVGTNHFDEVNQKTVFGFFDLYHGQKSKGIVDGIKGFLKGFLDMAQDAQAVYEFLQNAVDANSSHFIMVWGEDETELNEEGKPVEYLLVINNGWQFDFPAIQSILNVGVSTKTEDEHTIGKFGIGFKLAHRLVGKENGLDELLDKNYGPVLFSWKNGELRNLIDSDVTSVVPVAQEYSIERQNGELKVDITTHEPWLFKILITNFPTQPDELIRDAYYAEKNDAFSQSDVRKLGTWLSKFKDVIPLEGYDTGSLFFLKLGADKSHVLGDRNLEEGIRFSLSILNKVADSKVKGLQQVHLNGTDIKNAPLEFKSFIIPKDAEEYRYIRFGKKEALTPTEQAIADKDSDIQFLFGFTDYINAINLIDNVPNFYLYFPLSEEKHKLKFILHSNAFYKKSARTSLHSDALNVRLLEVFAQKLITFLTSCSENTNQATYSDFLAIYPLLLLSEESNDADKKWINKPLISSIRDFVKTHIPVVANTPSGFEIESDSFKVKIKSTKLELNPAHYNLPYEWFYWSNDEMLSTSIKLSRFSILELLYEPGVAQKINKDLERDPKLLPIILDEINAYIQEVTGSGKDAETFKDNFYKLKLFLFDDGTLQCINELNDRASEKKYLLLFEEIETIKDLLGKAGFVYSKNGLSTLPGIQYFIRARGSVHYNDYKVLNDYLSNGFEKAKFSAGEKHRIFKALENAKSNENSLEQLTRMQTLRLFCNQLGDIVALGALLKSTQKSWLEPFKISEAENNEILYKYLVETENVAYTKVVIPLWDNIMADKKGLIRKDVKSFYADIHTLQEATNQNQTLSSKIFIPLESGFSANSGTIFFQSSWGILNPEEYDTLAVLFKSIFGKALPLFDSVPYLKDAPFNLSNTTSDALTIESSKPVSLKDMALVGKAAHIASLPLFEKFVIEKEATTYILRSKHDTEEMVWCNQEDIVLHGHLTRFHKTLVIAPAIPELKNLVVLKENDLLDFLMGHWEPSDEAYTNAFTGVIVTKEDSFKKEFINKLGTVVYSFEDGGGFTTLNNVVKVVLSFSDINTSRDLFQTTIKFVVNAGLSFTLNDIISIGSDTIYFGDENQYQLKLSDIFTSDNLGYARYIEILIEKLTSSFSYEKVKLNQLFGLKTTEDKEDILARINDSIQNTGYLPNTSQLAFLLLYKKYSNKDFDLSGYIIKHRETTKKLNGVFALSMHRFNLFHADAYLDEVYDALATLLKLTDTTPSFKAGECSCYLHPVIENNVLLCPDLKENLQEDEQIQLLDFLIRYHKNSSPLTYRKTWSAIFGVRPELYNSSGKYMLKDVENFPEHIYLWRWNELDPIRKNHKAKLLSALGFNLPWAPINTLREVLIDPGTTKAFPLPELNDLPVELVANTLIFLHQNLPAFKFSQQSKNYDLLKEIVKICIQHSKIKIPLPVSTGSKEEYHFVDPSIDTVYYYDVNKYHELEKLGLDADGLVRSTGCNIYNSLSWTESQELKQLLQEIEIEEFFDNDLVLHTREEWSDTFYREWKSTHPDILLYYYNNLPVKLLLRGVYIKTISKDEFYFDENAIHCPKKFSFSEIIRILKPTKWISLNALNALESLFNMHQMKVAELLNNPIMDAEIRKLVEDKRKELEQLAYRKELIEILSKSEYSLKWFMSFIELQISQNNESDHSTPEQELSFFHVEWDKDSRRLLNFKDPNRTVTPTIEYCTDFSATFIFDNSKPIELKIQDVSKKGQVLNVMPARPELIQNINLNEIKRVDLKFSRSVDLLRRLLNAFKRLGNERSWQETYNLKDNLSHDIHFIFGPPGTGKTTTIAKRITDIMNTDPAAKVLVLTPTNKAADVLTQRIMKCTGENDYWLVRYGASFSNDIVERGLLQNKDSFIYEAYTKCVCITTIHRLPYEQAILKMENNEDIFSELGDMHWDYVIFDESSMIPLSYMIYAIYKCKSRFENKATAFWVAGDPLQIPPVIEIDDEDLPIDFNKEANIYTMIGLDTFDEAAQKAIPVYGENNKIENLTTQYRSIEQIGKLFSEFSYNGNLHHHRATVAGPEKFSRNFPAGFAHLGIKPVTLLKFPVNMDDSVYTPGKLRKSAYHIYSAILVLELVKKFNESLQDNEVWTMGIVCPYRSQATLINKMIESLSLKPNLTVITDTVHGFQGDECDMVYFIVNPPNYSISSPSYGAFIHKHYLINVAISRAKDYLIVLYPDDDTKGIENLEKLNFQHDGSIEQILNVKMGVNLDDITIHSSFIEEKILKKKGFIQENSRTNKHQLVNVYNLAEKPYIVKESTTAIDIQFKN